MGRLPSDLQSRIIELAEVPIDTYLYYRKVVGANPKKLKIPLDLKESLEKFYDNRAKTLVRKKKIEKEQPGCSTYLAYYTKKFDEEHSINICIGDDEDDVIKLAFRAQLTTYHDPMWPELWTKRKIVCNVHTGQETTDWMGDSDTDEDYE